MKSGNRRENGVQLTLPSSALRSTRSATTSGWLANNAVVDAIEVEAIILAEAGSRSLLIGKLWSSARRRAFSRPVVGRMSFLTIRRTRRIVQPVGRVRDFWIVVKWAGSACRDRLGPRSRLDARLDFSQGASSSGSTKRRDRDCVEAMGTLS